MPRTDIRRCPNPICGSEDVSPVVPDRDPRPGLYSVIEVLWCRRCRMEFFFHRHM